MSSPENEGSQKCCCSPLSRPRCIGVGDCAGSIRDSDSALLSSLMEDRAVGAVGREDPAALA